MDTEIQTTESPKKPKSPLSQAGSVVGGIFGVAVGWYCGIQLLIPVALAFGVGWLLTKTASSPATFREAWAVQAGHGLWMTIGGALTGGWSQVALDLAVLMAGLIWLWARPGIGPVILLGFYQLAAGVMNVVTLLGVDTASVPHKALVAHICFRAAALALLITGYVKLRKQQGEIILPAP